MAAGMRGGGGVHIHARVGAVGGSGGCGARGGGGGDGLFSAAAAAGGWPPQARHARSGPSTEAPRPPVAQAIAPLRRYAPSRLDGRARPSCWRSGTPAGTVAYARRALPPHSRRSGQRGNRFGRPAAPSTAEEWQASTRTRRRHRSGPRHRITGPRSHDASRSTRRHGGRVAPPPPVAAHLVTVLVTRGATRAATATAPAAAAARSAARSAAAAAATSLTRATPCPPPPSSHPLTSTPPPTHSSPDCHPPPLPPPFSPFAAKRSVPPPPPAPRAAAGGRRRARPIGGGVRA